MNFEPQKFYIGLIDFFSILLPGALITYLLRNNLSLIFLEKPACELGNSEGWMVFFFCSYLLGHFIFLLGSCLLDDFVYDRIRNASYENQIERLAKGDKLSSSITRFLANIFFKNSADKALKQVVRIKEHYLDPLNASSAINAFQWSKVRLTNEQPAALATVQRFEADSKFFRSLLIVFFLLFPLKLATNSWIAFGSFFLLLLAFWRYMDQRLKATNQAYWYIITIESQREGGYRHPPIIHTHLPTHAGGVVFKQIDDEVRYLLVRAKNDPKIWVLPKGHIESGESTQTTAVREVLEETGVWARFVCELETITYMFNNSPVEVQFYFMEAVAGRESQEHREYRWFSFSDALNQISHTESRNLLEKAEQKRLSFVQTCKR